MAVLAPAPVLAAELWCMPETICNVDMDCHSTTDEESSVRLNDLNAVSASLRTHAEDVSVQRNEADGVVQWLGTNSNGNQELLVWTMADNAFTYKISFSDGQVWKANGYCEVQ